MSNNRYKILVVEDEANIRGLVGAILETNGYQVLSAGTCAQGELLFSSHLPDLVFLDLGLPDRDGLELIRFVRQSFATPIIVLSARSHEGEKVAALDLGANDYITKPFGTGELLARVRAALRSSRRGEAAAGGSFTLPFTFSTLADYISSDRSAMMRELRRLREEGRVSVKGRQITLPGQKGG